MSATIVRLASNAGDTLDDARRVIPAGGDLQIGWLEEPFPALDNRAYQAAGRSRSRPDHSSAWKIKM